ncbi:phosphatidylethanolamine N-methyltransferase isoform X3 [Oryctolagus cuniculus]|uniref:phosphatidylethanolamine N-methyltransferase isoform X3 n=1 Tax=Oryctolagus cuniculus TaxID=9986 RepID=UPI003878FD25
MNRTVVTFAGPACSQPPGLFPEGRPARYEPTAGLRGPLPSQLRGRRPHHCFQPTLLECGCKMGTENSQAEQGLWVPLPSLLCPGRCHLAAERVALALLHPGHGEPAQVGQPGQPQHPAPGPRAPGRGHPVCGLQLPRPGLHRNLPRYASPTGLLLTAVVALVYMVAVYYEEPFTAEIYRQKTTRPHKRR